MMQNHLEISSKSEFWTRSVPNWSKLSYGKLTESWRLLQDLSRRTHMGPHGPIWAHMGRAHIWAHNGPYGAHMGPNPDHSEESTRPRINKAHYSNIVSIYNQFEDVSQLFKFSYVFSNFLCNKSAAECTTWTQKNLKGSAIKLKSERHKFSNKRK